DTATAKTPVPAVMCFPGSVFSKEYLAGEELLESPVCRFEKYPERNRMALWMVKNGMVAIAFDHPEIAECAIDVRDVPANYYATRTHLCFGYIQSGMCYPGVSVFQKLVALDFIKTLPYVKENNIATCGHSLGSLPALMVGMFRKEVKAVVFNDFVCDPRVHYSAITEEPSTDMQQSIGNWHEIPGLWRWFGHQDMLAALAPKYLALNEGGAEEWLDTVRRAYEINGVSARLQITYYPKYRDSEQNRLPMPDKGLSIDTFFEIAKVDAPDHSFRGEPTVRFLKKVFE
ncbi:MAG: alpha/beta hydrolase family protein, partial [Clostridia bacterium]|nr:alpha/beta hydrolase family protein [Clostridia bacterium]